MRRPSQGIRGFDTTPSAPLDRFIMTDAHLAQKDFSNSLFVDTNALDMDFLEAAIKQRGVPETCFGTEVPGSGAGVRLDFLTEDDNLAIFNGNPLKLFPTFARVAKAAATA
jgi:hypothetical protein